MTSDRHDFALGLTLIAFVGLFTVLGRQWAQGSGYAASMLLAWMLTSGKWSPKLWMLKREQKKLRKHLRLVRDDDDPKKWLN